MLFIRLPENENSMQTKSVIRSSTSYGSQRYAHEDMRRSSQEVSWNDSIYQGARFKVDVVWNRES